MSAGPIDDHFHWKADTSFITIRGYEDVFLAFNTLSGDTHILNFLSEALLRLLVDQSWMLPELSIAVREKLGITDDDCPDSLIKTTLHELDDLGLAFPRVDDPLGATA